MHTWWCSGRTGVAFMLLCLAATCEARAQDPQRPLTILDVPFISQTQALCGGAAAAMVLRFWGERGLSAESFAHLVDHSAAGIRTDALIGELTARGWSATGLVGDDALITRELTRGRPVLALIEDRPGVFHYIVIVAADASAVIFHDPARLPFRVMTGEEFARRWRAAGHWMAVVVPGDEARGNVAPSREGTDAAASAPAVAGAGDRGSAPCEQRIEDGVRHAQANDLAAAERLLASALPCAGSVALRELAGVRLLQRRWSEVAELAEAALAGEPSDAHAWRLLATSRFVQTDPARALDAWNAVGEPRLDLIRVEGAARTRHRVVERLIGITPGELLTDDRLRRARRRLGELPSAHVTRLEYVPVPAGLAELRAGISERPRAPSSVWDYAGIGLMAATRRELAVTSGALTGGGERITAAWRFWPERPRWALEFATPVAGGSVLHLESAVERQPFDAPAGLEPVKRMMARAMVTRWVTSRTRWSVRGGIDRWGRTGALGVVGSGFTFLSGGERLETTIDLDRWIGARPFGRAYASLRVSSSAVQRGGVVQLVAGAGTISRQATPDLWFAGDTGHVRPVLLRAHPVLDGGALRSHQLGRAMWHTSVEARRWWRGPVGTRFAAAAFVDAARTGRRLVPGSRGEVDAGAGARLALPGMPGVLRIDVATGLRDRASAISFVYDR